MFKIGDNVNFLLFGNAYKGTIFGWDAYLNKYYIKSGGCGVKVHKSYVWQQKEVDADILMQRLSDIENHVINIEKDLKNMTINISIEGKNAVAVKKQDQITLKKEYKIDFF